MSSLILMSILQVSVGASGADSYQEAYRATRESGRPLVVLVGADWCGACQTMKQSVIPQVRRNGGFKRVTFTYVDADSATGRGLMQGSSIPQLIVYSPARGGKWLRHSMIGLQSATQVQYFVTQHTPAETQQAAAEKPIMKLSSSTTTSR